MKHSSEASEREQISGIHDDGLVCVESSLSSSEEGPAEQITNGEQSMESAERGRSKQAREHLEEVENEVFFLAASPAMQKIRAQIAQVAWFDIPVLLLGESGVGKEVRARLTHNLSRRAGKPLVKVN